MIYTKLATENAIKRLYLNRCEITLLDLCAELQILYLHIHLHVAFSIDELLGCCLELYTVAPQAF